MRKKYILYTIAAVSIAAAALLPLSLSGCGGAGEADLPPELIEARTAVVDETAGGLSLNFTYFFVTGQDGTSGNDWLSLRIKGGTAPYKFSTSGLIRVLDATGTAIYRLADPGYVYIDPYAFYSEEGGGTIAYLYISDSEGNSSRVTVYILSSLSLTASPEAITIYGLDNGGVDDTTDDITVYITGGSGSFSVRSSSNVIAPPVSVTSCGAAYCFTVDPDNVLEDTEVILTITDTLSQSVELAVTITPPDPGLSIQPESISIRAFANPDGNTTDDRTFSIIGGVPPYTVVSSRPTLALPSAISASYTFTVDPTTTGVVNTTTNVTLTVTDSVGSPAVEATLVITE